MTNQLKRKWETDQDSFKILSKKEFDDLHHKKSFVDGPIVAMPSQFASEFGPCDPHRWALGQLTDGRFVCCSVVAEEQNK